ncbi:hypothetical protein GHT06_017740 [Daphnia sinensis]|uniref:Exonuclease domain-containing protein n=1 Tax=Daphnia sinensis TaxID=1820382 RepID=A0AAD5PU25_9CRUS|nr:hypothetical protein GHT06_017740 [Daphnia sinensis]
MSVPDAVSLTVSINSLVFFDLETTGLPADHPARITELNFCGVDRMQFMECKSKKMPRVTNRLNLCIDPSRPIDPVATDLSKLDNRNLGKQSKFDADVFNVIVSFLSRLQKPICLIAHNGANFDFPIFKAEIAKFGEKFPQDLYCADSLKIFGLLQGISTDPPKAKRVRKTKSNSLRLNEIYQRIYKKKPETLHEAEADVRMLFLSAIAAPEEFLKAVESNAVPLTSIPKCW